MPFEPSPKTEQEQRVQMGRIALDAIAARVLTIPDKQWHFSGWRTQTDCGTVGCAIGHSYDLPEVVATGLRPAALGYPTHPEASEGRYEDGGCMTVIDHAFSLPAGTAQHFFWGAKYRERTTQQVVSARIRHYLATGAIV